MSHYTWRRGIKVAGVSKSRGLSWIIWVVPVETRVFTRKEEKEQTIRGLRLEGLAAKAGFGNEGGRKTWSKKGGWPLETAKGRKPDFPLQCLGRNGPCWQCDPWWSSDKQKCKKCICVLLNHSFVVIYCGSNGKLIQIVI